MLYTKIQPQCFLGSGEEDFKYFFFFFFLTIWQLSCSIMQNHLDKLIIYPSDRRSHVKSGETGQAVSENKTFKDYTIL